MTGTRTQEDEETPTLTRKTMVGRNHHRVRKRSGERGHGNHEQNFKETGNKITETPDRHHYLY